MMDINSNYTNFNDLFISSIAKSELLAAIGQELNTPMNVISGMISMLENTSLGDDQKDYLDMMKSSSSLLSELVNNILNISNINTGKILLQNVPFNVERVTNDLLSQMILEADKKSIQLRLQFDKTIPSELLGDPKRFSLILFNLINNGIKFSNGGFVQLNIKVNEETDNKIELHCCVEDTGVGISEELMRKLFHSGSGLGLMITKIIVEEMDGEITVHSREGKGSRFSFTCKLEKAFDGNSIGGHIQSSNKTDSKNMTLDQEIFDKDLLLKKLNNNIELYNKIVDVFFNETSQKLVELKSSVEGKDYEKIISISHSIKGAAGNITASRVQECAKTLEFAGKDKEINDIDVLFEKLSNEFYRIKEKDINIL